jgi:hypothetical protein
LSGEILIFGALGARKALSVLRSNRLASHNFKVSTNSNASSDAAKYDAKSGYFVGSAVFETFAISCANRAAILLLPLRSAIFHTLTQLVERARNFPLAEKHTNLAKDARVETLLSRRHS